MKSVVIFVLLGVHAAHAVTHSLQYFLTTSTQVPNFPEFVSVAMVDDIQITYYDSITKREVPKQDWMNKAAEDDPKFWDWNTGNCVGAQHRHKNNLEVAMQRFNQSGGVHINQMTVACELDEDGTTRGHWQYGYDGEDFLILDQSTLTWTAANQKAVITKLRWDATGIVARVNNDLLENGCIEWLKKYVNYGKDTLGRQVPPSVSLFQKSASSPVTCHATGFYPRGVMVFWERDGEWLREDVDLGEILPNPDGTFQTRSSLSVSAEELDTHNYTCVVQHSSDSRDIVLTVVDLRKKDSDPGSGSLIGLIAGIIAAVGLLALIVGVGLLVWKKKTRKPGPDFTLAEMDDGSNTSNDAEVKT